MEEKKPPEVSHAKAPRRKEREVFAPLRLCVRFFCSASFVLCFALIVRFGVLLLTPGALQNDPDDYRRLAENLVENRTFGCWTQPTAFRPPLYPLVLTGCIVLGTHDGTTVILAMTALHVLLGVATVGLVFLLAQTVGIRSARCRHGRASGHLRPDSAGQFVARNDRDAGDISYNGGTACADLGRTTANKRHDHRWPPASLTTLDSGNRTGTGRALSSRVPALGTRHRRRAVVASLQTLQRGQSHFRQPRLRRGARENRDSPQ